MPDLAVALISISAATISSACYCWHNEDRRQPRRLPGALRFAFPSAVSCSDQWQILVAVFVGVPAADDAPTGYEPADDIGPLIDFNLFPNREQDEEFNQSDSVEITFGQFHQVCCLSFSPTMLTFLRYC